MAGRDIMEARAIAKGVGMSARKVRMVVDLIRGRNVNEAYSILKFSKRAATAPIEKTLRSAVANAQQKADAEGNYLDTDELVVRAAFVNEGPTMKRWRARAMGRASPIMKRTSHITIVVDRKE
jgi:large subunit ribosomal protein L22